MDLPVNPPIAPMLAKSVADIPEGPFSYEPKWDGFRAVIFRDGDEVEIGSRNERPMTRYFPELVAAIKAELPDRCVIDGEIVTPDGEGRRLDFEALLQRIHPAATRINLLAEQTPAHLGCFDALAVGGANLTAEPFSARRGALGRALAAAGTSVHLPPATTDRATAQDWFGQFEGAGLDGVVAKRLDGPYVEDKRTMFKIKHERTADCVVAGYRPHKSGPDAIGSLRPRPFKAPGGAGPGGGERRVPDGAAPRADDGAAALGDQLRRAPVELAAARGRPAHPAQGRGQPVELGQGPVVRTAAARAGGRGPLRPHGRCAVPPHRAVRP